MSSRSDGITLLSSLVNFGALTAFLVLHVSVIVHHFVRKGSRDWWRHLVSPALGFLILAFVVVNAKSQHKRSALCGWPSVSSSFWASSSLVANQYSPEPSRTKRSDEPGRGSASPGTRSVGLRIRWASAPHHGRPRAGHRALNRGLLRGAGQGIRGPAQPGLHIPLPQPGHRAHSRPRRRAGRHHRRSLRRHPTGQRLGHLIDIPPLRGTDINPHHRNAPCRAGRARVGVRRGCLSGGLPVQGPQQLPRGGATARPDARHGRARPRSQRGDHEPHPRRPRRQHGHARDPFRHHGLLRAERQWWPRSDGRRPLPTGRGRGVWQRCRVSHGDCRDPRPDQGWRSRVAADRERPLPHEQAQPGLSRTPTG